MVICENCKPILGEKIRFHRDKVFTDRLRPAPVVPQIDMAIHLARVQQRWRFADDELAPGETLNIDALAHDIPNLPDLLTASPDKVAEDMLGFFRQYRRDTSGAGDQGGTIEAAADEDGVLMTDVRELAPAPQMATSSQR